MSVKISSSASFLLPSPTTLQDCRGRNSVCGVVLPKLPYIAKFSLSLGNGLRSPPVDDMSATYQPAMPAYESHTLHSYSSALPQSGHIKPVIDDGRGSQQCRYSSQPVQVRNGQYSTAPMTDTTLLHTSGSSTPAADSSISAKRSQSTSRRGSETLIYHSLQLPKCISPTGGNLSEFAAQVSYITTRIRNYDQLCAFY